MKPYHSSTHSFVILWLSVSGRNCPRAFEIKVGGKQVDLFQHFKKELCHAIFKKGTQSGTVNIA
jgi:hypothetical protein